MTDTPRGDDGETPSEDTVHIRRMIDDFFAGPANPVNNHEEWLLRLAASLMEREALCVSMQRQGEGVGGRRKKAWKTGMPS